MNAQPPMTVAQVFAALATGLAKPFTSNDHSYFDAPAGSMKIESEDGWMYVIASNFVVEAHCFNSEDNGFQVSNGEWLAN